MIFVVSTPAYFATQGIQTESRVHSVDGSLCFIHKEELQAVIQPEQYTADNGKLFTEYSREKLDTLLQTDAWRHAEETA